MELFLLRHGIAVERGTPDLKDDDRPLTPAGRRALQKVVRAMKRMELTCARVVSSPLPRARQTAELVAAGLQWKRPVAFSEQLRPGRDAGKLLKELAALRPAPKSLLLVGHEPDLSELISLLVTGETGAGIGLKKGGLAKLEVGKLRAGKCATLAWLLTPKQMKLMR